MIILIPRVDLVFYKPNMSTIQGYNIQIYRFAFDSIKWNILDIYTDVNSMEQVWKTRNITWSRQSIWKNLLFRFWYFRLKPLNFYAREASIRKKKEQSSHSVTYISSRMNLMAENHSIYTLTYLFVADKLRVRKTTFFWNAFEQPTSWIENCTNLAGYLPNEWGQRSWMHIRNHCRLLWSPSITKYKYLNNFQISMLSVELEKSTSTRTENLMPLAKLDMFMRTRETVLQL